MRHATLALLLYTASLVASEEAGQCWWDLYSDHGEAFVRSCDGVVVATYAEDGDGEPIYYCGECPGSGCGAVEWTVFMQCVVNGCSNSYYTDEDGVWIEEMLRGGCGNAAFGADCSTEWCRSPDGDDGHDCWAGSEDEACKCSKGEARLTGETGKYDGTKYYEYTCCEADDGTNVGEECGDYEEDAAWWVVLLIVFFCCVVPIGGVAFCCCAFVRNQQMQNQRNRQVQQMPMNQQMQVQSAPGMVMGAPQPQGGVYGAQPGLQMGYVVGQQPQMGSAAQPLQGKVVQPAPGMGMQPQMGSFGQPAQGMVTSLSNQPVIQPQQAPSGGPISVTSRAIKPTTVGMY